MKIFKNISLFMMYFPAGSPEPSSPLNCDAGNLLRAEDIRGYWSLARMATLEYAEMLPTKKNKETAIV